MFEESFTARESCPRDFSERNLTQELRCSIHQQENEDVIETCLEERKADFELKRILPNWSRRGLPVFPDVYLEYCSDQFLTFSCV